MPNSDSLMHILCIPFCVLEAQIANLCLSQAYQQAMIWTHPPCYPAIR